jgi:general secretion pathway protein I
VRAERRSFRHDHRGFTLIEVVVALIVVSLGMLAVIETVGGTARNSSYLRDKTIAHWVAMNKLTEVRVLPNAPAVDKTSDKVEMAGRDWRWTMEVKQTPVESIRRIDISVRPAEAPEKSSMASVSGFYGTAVAPAGTTVVMWKGSPNGGPGSRGTRGGQDGQGSEGERPPPPNNTPPPTGDPPTNDDIGDPPQQDPPQ